MCVGRAVTIATSLIFSEIDLSSKCHDSHLFRAAPTPSQICKYACAGPGSIIASFVWSGYFKANSIVNSWRTLESESF